MGLKNLHNQSWTLTSMQLSTLLSTTSLILCIKEQLRLLIVLDQPQGKEI